MNKSHALKPHAKPAVISWPSYTGDATFVGASPSGRVSVYYDATLGAPALQNATDLVANADSLCDQDDAIFGTKGGPVNVIVFALGGATDGTGGADHQSCSFIDGADLECDASFGNSARVYGLFEAERSECQMGGNLCGTNLGESLSRWCAMVVSNNALSDFATGPQWVADGSQDFVNVMDPTDQNPDSTGCGMIFLSWVQSLGYKLSQIAPAMVADGDQATFATLYAKLGIGPATDAWAKFQAAIAALPNGVQSDDPFGALGQPQPGPTPTPQPGPGTSTTQLAVLAIEACTAALINGESEPDLKAELQSILNAN